MKNGANSLITPFLGGIAEIVTSENVPPLFVNFTKRAVKLFRQNPLKVNSLSILIKHTFMSANQEKIIAELELLRNTANKLKNDINRLIDEIESDDSKKENRAFNRYLKQISSLVDSGLINNKHYNWGRNGKQLKIWSRAIWDIYISSIIRGYKPEHKGQIEDHFCKLSGQENTITVSFKNAKGGFTRQKGYRIENAHKHDLLAITFNCPLNKTDS